MTRMTKLVALGLGLSGVTVQNANAGNLPQASFDLTDQAFVDLSGNPHTMDSVTVRVSGDDMLWMGRLDGGGWYRVEIQNMDTTPTYRLLGPKGAPLVRVEQRTGAYGAPAEYNDISFFMPDQTYPLAVNRTFTGQPVAVASLDAMKDVSGLGALDPDGMVANTLIENGRGVTTAILFDAVPNSVRNWLQNGDASGNEPNYAVGVDDFLIGVAVGLTVMLLWEIWKDMTDEPACTWSTSGSCDDHLGGSNITCACLQPSCPFDEWTQTCFPCTCG